MTKACLEAIADVAAAALVWTRERREAEVGEVVEALQRVNRFRVA